MQKILTLIALMSGRFDTMTGEIQDADDAAVARASGVVFPLAIGVDWRLGKRFRLGPQAQAYLQVSSEICADVRLPGVEETVFDGGQWVVEG